MKKIFDFISYECSKKVTKTYSTSFSLGTRLLSKNIRKDIYNIYGFVRFADEIVDSFHDFDKSLLFNEFSKDLEKALERKIHLNVSDETLAKRRIQQDKNGWIPKKKRKRKVTTALKAYAALTTSASKGAVRVVD